MNKNNSGISFAALLGLVFIVLKLVGVIDWAWIWVLAPFWAGIAIALILLVISGILLVISKLLRLEKK